MIRVIAICLAVAIGVMPTVALAQNSGLERLARPDQITSWKAVGRVDVGNAHSCTGTLIAADLVLTAAHCLFGPGGSAHPVGSITFRAGHADGVSVADAQVARATAHQRYQPSLSGLQTALQMRYDVALLELSTPISTALAPPFAVDRPGTGDVVSVVSYARGRDAALSWQRACTVLGREQGLIAVDCDVTFGSSGAPVFDRSRGRARIVSIISGGLNDKDKTVAFGMELPQLVSDLKAQLRAGRGVIEAREAAPTARRIGAGTTDRSAGGARFLRPPGN
ncbi:MAG: trypsin-like peptidase domain-containing protein [Pseudotabrizicola sp.]|uniref:trypsin-like serine peptidase n=1 Tax=Pseudotabrizicola sp. TaxID=2939647 RepID=UPI002730D35B|nr:trypsin-like peptidase domain-containing protein [Pseudotabrizicola sp.]MDP2081703.1 trypsin-like peptidase domain-containing protein [Pseudotabrizicola sp.]MDZ7574053.1 trypsin-like peptidase domain-containing protein [Pseudotabrizicola sp.]